jgi:hypothetical protein
MYFPADLLTFIRAHRNELTLSVYVEAAPHDPAARRNWRVRLRQGLNELRVTLSAGPADELDAFERCAADVLERLPAGDTSPATHGWACFATASGDVFATGLPDATETNVSWGPGARVVPYLRHITVGHALVVRIDREHARIQRWHEGALDPLVVLEADTTHDVGTHMGDAPRQGFHGGTRGRTGADEDQRQKRDATERLLAEVRARVVALVDEHEPVLIGGAGVSSGHLLDLLPELVATRAVVVPALIMTLSDAAALPVIHDALIALDSTSRMRRVTELRELAHARGRAAVGFAPASAAADLGAIAELIFSERAWRQHPDEIEDLVRRALMEGANVTLAPSSPGMPSDVDTDGVIAGLRFPLPASR